jgi:L-ascorbate metabolism protein UlaG (beta-lactamase superfamily)
MMWMPQTYRLAGGILTMKHPLMLGASLLAALVASSPDAGAQARTDSVRATRPDTMARRPQTNRPQAKAPPTQPFGAEAFGRSEGTTLRWLGMAGFFINSRGTTLMVDPLLEGFDMPVLITFPIAAKDVPRLDAVLVTHSDNDHYSVPTNKALASVTRTFHSTHYVDTLMQRDGLRSVGHDIGGKFTVGPANASVRVTVTPADHDWQNAMPARPGARRFRKEDSAGFWIETPDGTIWAPGDSRLIPEHHLAMPAPDALLFDFSDSEFHFTLAGAVRMANAYPDTPLLLYHWGSVNAPAFTPFNGDPWTLFGLVKNPGRIRVLAPGEAFTLTRLKQLKTP